MKVYCLNQIFSFTLLISGKSLDKIAELREKGYIKDPTEKKTNLKKKIAAEVRLQNRKVFWKNLFLILI